MGLLVPADETGCRRGVRCGDRCDTLSYNRGALNGEEFPMSALIPTVVLIIAFLLIALTLRAAGRRAARTSSTRAGSDSHNRPGQA